MQTLNNVLIFSHRQEFISFCQKVFDSLDTISFSSQLESLEKCDATVFIYDATIFSSQQEIPLKSEKENHQCTICLLPPNINPLFQQQIYAQFDYIISYPCNENLFCAFYKNILADLLTAAPVKKVNNLESVEDRGDLEGYFQGNSEVMKNFRTTVKNIALQDKNVLILGETGTGKTLLAKLIHNLSNRKKKPYKVQNVKEIDDVMASTTLFGCVTGAYTDAVDHPGIYEANNKGTVFLDEIGLASPEMQGKLLSLLQDGIVTRVGSERNTQVDVRTICATNENVKRMLAEKTFRTDLYYRIAKTIIRIPSLKDRPEDIPIIANSYVQKYGKSISPASMNILTSYKWPGNIRQLHDCLDNAISLTKGNIIYPEHIGELG